MSKGFRIVGVVAIERDGETCLVVAREDGLLFLETWDGWREIGNGGPAPIPGTIADIARPTPNETQETTP